MRAVFGADLDGAAWPHVLAYDDAVLGDTVVGPERMLEILETRLGLLGRRVSAAVRTAVYAERMARVDGSGRFWHRSFQVDPWGTARHVLRMRDALAEAGWSEKAVTGRLHDLAAIERVGLPLLPEGDVERLRAVESALRRGGAPVEEVVLVDPVEALSPAWGRILRLLPCTSQAATPDAIAPVGTDLHDLQTLLSDPSAAAREARGDGTVLHLRARDPAQGAEMLAAWLAANPPGEAVVVRGGVPEVLDEALMRHGLPALGSSRSSRWRPAVQVLTLAYALAWRPLDAGSLLELLTLPTCPVPAAAAARLAATLREAPGIRGESWMRAWDEAVRSSGEAAEEDRHLRERRTQVRLELWLGADAVAVHDPDDGMPREAALGIAGRVYQWARARLRAAPDDRVFEAASNQAAAMTNVLESWRAAAVARSQIEQMLEAVQARGASAASIPGQVGRMPPVDAPGAMYGPADTVVWWHFQAPSEGPLRPPVRREEQEALGLPCPSVRWLAAARAQARPVLNARERVILVSAEANGPEALRVHPLYDEVRARLCPSAVSEARIVRGLDDVRRVARTVAVRTASPRAPEVEWRLAAGAVPPRAKESASSIEALLGCPLQWVLRYAARLSPGALAGVADGVKLKGTLAHAVIGAVLTGSPVLPQPDEAAELARACFDERVQREAAPLSVSARAVERGDLRETVAAAARTLVLLLRDGGYVVEAVEAQRNVPFGEGTLEGRLDLLLRHARGPALLDLKHGGGAYRRAQLREGRAVQLAAYAHLAREGASLPPVGYFTITDRELLAVEGDAFPGATVVAGEDMDATWGRVVELFERTLSSVREGRVAARGRLDAPDGVGIEAPCGFCDYVAICKGVP